MKITHFFPQWSPGCLNHTITNLFFKKAGRSLGNGSVKDQTRKWKIIPVDILSS